MHQYVHHQLDVSLNESGGRWEIRKTWGLRRVCLCECGGGSKSACEIFWQWADCGSEDFLKHWSVLWRAAFKGVHYWIHHWGSTNREAAAVVEWSLEAVVKGTDQWQRQWLVSQLDSLRLTFVPAMVHIYLLRALPDQGDKLGDDQVYAFQTGVFQLNDLLFHYGLKSQIWGEETCPVVRHHESWSSSIGGGKKGIGQYIAWDRVEGRWKKRKWW